MIDEDAFRLRLAANVVVRWDAPREAEPSYGMMARIAALHRQTSLPVFAREMAIEDGPEWPRLCLEALAACRFASNDEIESIRRFTPVVEGKDVIIAGQRMRRVDWSVTTRRHCPGCLHESGHHRVWFDLAFMARCPHHGLELNDGDPGEIPLNWNFSCLDETPAGRRLTLPVERTAAGVATFEGFVLARMGLMETRTNPLLDGISIPSVQLAAEALGRLAIGGWRLRMPSPADPGFEVATTRAAGFAVLDGGEAAVDDLLRRIAEAAPPSTFGTKTLFGWASQQFLNRNGLSRRLVRRMADVAAGMGRGGRRRDGSKAANPDSVSIAAAASRLGVKRSAVETMATMMGAYLPHVGRKGAPLLIGIRDIERMRCKLAAALTDDQAAEAMALPVDLLIQVVAAGHLSRMGMRWGAGLAERFDRDDIDALLDSIPLKSPRARPLEPGVTVMVSRHIPTVVEALAHTAFDAGAFLDGVMSGGIAVMTRTSLEGGLSAFRIELAGQRHDHPFIRRWMSLGDTRDKTVRATTMSQREACAVLDLRPETVKTMTDLGHLRLADDKDMTERMKLDASSVEEFRRRYVAGRPYAPILGCTPQAITAKLAAAGVKTITEESHPDLLFGPGIQKVYDREQLLRAFGLSKDPFEEDPARAGWKAMAAWLGDAKSPFMLRSVREDGSATFSTSDSRWPIEVRYDFEEPVRLAYVPAEMIYTIKASLVLQGADWRDGIGDLAMRLRGRRINPEVTASCNLRDRICKAGMRAVFASGADPGLTGAEVIGRYAGQDVRVVNHMMHMLRATFDEGRPYDARMFGIWPQCFWRD